ncbi:hypothetical protein Hanom_Chr14g01260011 [Helianthus anomalus]
MLKGDPESASSDHVDLSDDIEVSEDQGPSVDVEKEKHLIVLGKKKYVAKKAMVTYVQGSPRKDIEGLSEDEIYVPNLGVKVGDSFKDAKVCADVLANFAPPPVFEEKMKASMAAMKKDIDDFAKKEEYWVKKVGELKTE